MRKTVGARGTSRGWTKSCIKFSVATTAVNRSLNRLILECWVWCSIFTAASTRASDSSRPNTQSVQCASEEQDQGGGAGEGCVSSLPSDLSPDSASLPSAQELREDYEEDQRRLNRIRGDLIRNWSLRPLIFPALYPLNHVPRV